VCHTVATHGIRLRSAGTGYRRTLSQSAITYWSLARYEIHRQTIFKETPFWNVCGRAKLKP
jgi:hypothetical protein